MEYHIKDTISEIGCYQVGYYKKDGAFECVCECMNLEDAEDNYKHLTKKYGEPKESNAISEHTIFENGFVREDGTFRRFDNLNAKPAKPKETEISPRDYFAGMAMQVLIKDFGIESTAQKAYNYADAMLAERSRTNE